MESAHILRTLIDETLAGAPQQGKRLLEPLKAFSLAHGVPVHILEDVAVSNPPEIHTKEADLWICISGNPTFVVGGSIVNPQPQVRPDGSINNDEITGDAVEGGTEYVLQPGEILFIPAGIPHTHRADESARLYIVKIPRA